MVLAQDGKTSQFPDHKVYPHAQRPIQCWRIQTASGEHCTGSKCDDLIERKGLLYAIDVEKAFGVFGEPAGDLVNGHKLLHPLVVFVISGWTVQILLKNPHPPLGIALLISKDIQPVLFVTRVQKVPMLSEVGSSDTDSSEKPPATFEDAFWLMGWRDERTIQYSIDRLARLKVNRMRVSLSGRTSTAYGEAVMNGPRWNVNISPWPAQDVADFTHPGFDYSRFDLAYWQKFERMLRYAREKRS